MSVVEGLYRDGADRARPRGRSELRAVLGRFATGVTVVACGEEAPCGMTANSFTSVSLDPPLVLVCVSQSAQLHEAVLEHGVFAVSILSEHQEHVARYFADHSRPRGRSGFAVAGWSAAPSTGSPILDGALGWLDCALVATHEGGDHAIFLGSVVSSGCDAAHDALLYFGGNFHRPGLGPLRESA